MNKFKQIVLDIHNMGYPEKTILLKTFNTPEEKLDMLYEKLFNNKQITVYDEDLFTLFDIFKSHYKTNIPLQTLILKENGHIKNIKKWDKYGYQIFNQIPPFGTIKYYYDKNHYPTKIIRKTPDYVQKKIYEYSNNYQKEIITIVEKYPLTKETYTNVELNIYDSKHRLLKSYNGKTLNSLQRQEKSIYHNNIVYTQHENVSLGRMRNWDKIEMNSTGNLISMETTTDLGGFNNTSYLSYHNNTSDVMVQHTCFNTPQINMNYYKNNKKYKYFFTTTIQTVTILKLFDRTYKPIEKKSIGDNINEKYSEIINYDKNGFPIFLNNKKQFNFKKRIHKSMTLSHYAI